MAAPSVHDLDLPLLDITGLGRHEALAASMAARRQHWLARTPMGYSIATYDDAVAVLRERRFHSAVSLIPQMQGLDPDDGLRRRRQSILSMEGAGHTRLRRLVAPAFTPGSADRLRPFMRSVVGELVAAVAPLGRCEFVGAVCEPYPIPIICELLGAPKEDWKRFSQWATDIFRVFNQRLAEDRPAIDRASAELEAYVRAMVDERRGAPRRDLLSDLIAVEEAGDRLTTDELVMMAEAILMAGTDTTRNQLACCVALFCEHPDQWARLAEQPELAPRAVEECMRYLGAVRGTIRVAAEDVEYRGVTFPRGTLVSVSLATANRDAGRFAQPERLDITAERSSGHLTFGSGIHHCLGAALARAELQEALAVLAPAMAELAADGPVVWKPPTFGIWGPAELPVRFRPGPS